MAQAIIDSQVKPNLSPPQKCPNGCARWKNLAEDGNTQNQYQVEAVWLDGIIPDSAGNQCAQPIGLPELTSPWCYCKGTNDGSFGYCEAPQTQQTQQSSTQESSSYKFTNGGYPQSGNGQNLSCFSNLSVGQAQQQCDNLGDKCAGFSISNDGAGNGCFKSDTNGGIVNDSGYNGYTKTAKPSRNAEAAICRSVPNGLNDLNSKIDDCTTTTEINRNTNFAANTFKLQKDIQTLTATVGDSLIMGDTMFGQYGYQDVAIQVKERNAELKAKKEKLLKEVDSNEAVIERSNRDFSDVKDTIKEPQPKKVLRFVEDYTLAFLSIAYLFMIIAVMYVYISTSELKLVAFGKSFVASIFLTIFLYMILYYLT